MQFKFNGSQTLTYPDISENGSPLVAEPGSVHDLDAAPDPRWEAVTSPSKAPEVPAEATQESEQ